MPARRPRLTVPAAHGRSRARRPVVLSHPRRPLGGSGSRRTGSPSDAACCSSTSRSRTGDFGQFTSWGAAVLVGELVAGDGFFTPKDGAAIVVKCVTGTFYGDTEVTRDDQKNAAITVDGHDAWIIESNLGFDVPGSAGQARVVDRGHRRHPRRSRRAVLRLRTRERPATRRTGPAGVGRPAGRLTFALARRGWFRAGTRVADHDSAAASRWKAERVKSATTTIFAEMSALAVATASVNLGQGFPDYDGPDFMLAAARDGHRRRASTSTRRPAASPPCGRRSSAHSARHYGLVYDADTEVLVTTGATEALAAAILAFVEPGDEVIALEPFYDSYAASIDLAGGTRVGVGLFGPDFAPRPGRVRGGHHAADQGVVDQLTAQSDRCRAGRRPAGPDRRAGGRSTICW